MAAATYPLHVDARLDAPLNRWLWLVKWVLAIPHYVVLAFLWIAFVALTVVAFFAILFTGRYPQSIFEFNVGVLRWTWRVQYYAYGALGTDRYPPFTLGDVPDYPAHLDVSYPRQLSRGLVLVKWWLLAIPQYIIVGLFIGGGSWAVWQADRQHWQWGGGGLVGILVLVAAVVLLFTGRYPQSLYDFVLGLNRWVLRVAAYAGLMTDKYPPFRLDMGGPDPDGVLAMGAPPAPAPAGAGPAAGTAGEPGAAPSAFTAAPAGAPAAPYGAYGAAPPPRAPSRWGAGRVIAVIVGALLVLVSSGLLLGGGAVLWADRTQRTDGYVTSGDISLVTGTFAVATDRIELGAAPGGWLTPSSLLGTVRLRATSDTGKPVFVGVAREADAEAYLAGVDYDTIRNFVDGGADYTRHAGARAPAPPAAAGIWRASATGDGQQTLTWKPTSGHWMVVVMNADASQGVQVTADAGATLPSLGWVAAGLLIAGAVFLVGGAVIIVVAVTTARPRATAATGLPPAGPTPAP